MEKCYLCSDYAEIVGQDYGRRKIVRCPSCIFYEITNTAIPKLEDMELPNELKKGLINTIKKLNKNGKEPEIVFDGNILSAREKKI